jgi:hypothetical protein
LHRASLGQQASYFCFLHSWVYRHAPSHLALKCY